MKIDFYFDFLSPYSYLAWCQLREMKFEQHAQLCYKPVVLSQVIGAHQSKGPSEIPPKRDYLFKDCLRKAHDHSIPFVVPKRLPFNSLYALRISLKQIAGERQFELIDKFFRAAWEEGNDLGDTNQLSLILNDDHSMIDLATSPQARKQLKENTQEAIDKGAFGVPTFVTSGELFWGHDSIPHLIRYLDGCDPVDAETVAHFRSIFGRE